MKTWEVKLDTKSNGVVTINVQADDFVQTSDGVTFVKGDDRVQVAFYPMATLLGVKDVTP
jgi:hypothetical protein